MSGMNLTVDDNLIRPVIEAEIHSAIVANLAQVDSKIVTEIVNQVLRMPVDDKGERDKYGYNKQSYLQWIVADAVRRATKEATNEYFDKHKGHLMEAVLKHLNASTDTLARVFVESLANAIQTSWRFQVTVNLPESNEK